MPRISYSNILEVDLGKLAEALVDWNKVVTNLNQLKTDAYRGMIAKSDRAQWEGVNSKVTKEFIRKTGKEFQDLHLEARSISNVLRDAHAELERIQKDIRKHSDKARKEETPLVVTERSDGSVRVMEAQCDVDGEQNQRTLDLVKWYEEAINSLTAHANEIDSYARKALRKCHGAETQNPGHARYASLDRDMIPKATKLASLGDDATQKQRAELRRIWDSLSPTTRQELWKAQKESLLAAGILTPTEKQIAPDKGSGAHGVDSPGFKQRLTKGKMELLAESSEFMGRNDAGRHMVHYLENSGEELELPVDRMLESDEGFQHHVRMMINDNLTEWRKDALKAYEQSGGSPVSVPIEGKNSDYPFRQDENENWFYAVGSTRSNVTGVMTVEPGVGGEPKISVEYQVNAWDRYNWDKTKSVDIGPLHIPDGEPGRLHEVGLAKEFDMKGSSSTKRIEVDTEADVSKTPKPDSSGRDGSRTDVERENGHR